MPSQDTNQPRKFLGLPVRLETVASAIYLAVLLAFAVRYLAPILFRTWFFSSDEYVFAAEVIRFSSLDFHQHFFDNPGTPFMMLNAAIWIVIYAGAWALGMMPPDARIGAFTFQHMPLLFTTMRATTLVLYVISAVLFFRLYARLAGRASAAVATLLLAFAPIYCYYTSFVRTESLALVCILCALLVVERAMAKGEPDWERGPGLGDYATIAGLLCGVAAGARLHSMTAVFPVLFTILWLQRRPVRTEYPVWIRRASVWALPAICAGAVGLVFFMRWTAGAFPAAIRMFTGLALAALLLCVGGFALYRSSATRVWVVRILSPDHLKLLVGFAGGLLLGNPTVLWQREYFFQSVQMYSGYLDRDRLTWPLWKNVVWYVNHYLDVLAPDTVGYAGIKSAPAGRILAHLEMLSLERLPLILLAIGCIWILWRRDRKMIPYLAGAAFFFVSKPINVVASPHHIILWLPFLFMVCAYPVGRMCEWIGARFGEAWAAAALAVVLAVLATQVANGPRVSYERAMATETRMHNIERATSWYKANAGPKDVVAISFYCFNPDVVYEWLKYLQAPVPAEVFDGREYQIWWGQGSALKGRTGYACATPIDIPAIKTTMDLVSPGEGTDPYHDARFQKAATFGSGENEVDLFKFDYR